MKIYNVTNIFDLHTFDNEATALLNFFEIFTEMHFVSLIFLNERNITTSLLMVHFKCTVVHYANLNSSPIKRSYLRAVEYAILFVFFRFLIYGYFNETFVKTFMKKVSFLKQISRIHFEM